MMRMLTNGIFLSYCGVSLAPPAATMH
jgi:hypothetical protein